MSRVTGSPAWSHSSVEGWSSAIAILIRNHVYICAEGWSANPVTTARRASRSIIGLCASFRTLKSTRLPLLVKKEQIQTSKLGQVMV